MQSRLFVGVVPTYCGWGMLECIVHEATLDSVEEAICITYMCVYMSIAVNHIV